MLPACKNVHHAVDASHFYNAAAAAAASSGDGDTFRN